MPSHDTLTMPAGMSANIGNRMRTLIAMVTSAVGALCVWSSGVAHLRRVGLLAGGCVALAALVAARRVRDPHGAPQVDVRPIAAALGAAWAGSVALSWAGAASQAPAWVVCVAAGLQVVESRRYGVSEWGICGVACLLAGVSGLVSCAWGAGSSWAVAGCAAGWALVVTAAISVFRGWPRAGRSHSTMAS